MSDRSTYYQRNSERIIIREKEYYENNKERLREQARNKYRKLSSQKNIYKERECGRNRYHNTSKENKKIRRLKED